MQTNTRQCASAKMLRVWWRTFHNNGRLEEIRIISNKGVLSGYYQDFDTLEADVMKYGNGAAVYFVINRIDPACYSRRQRGKMLLMGRGDGTTADTNITRREWVLIDLDPERLSGVSSTDEELSKAREKAEKIRAYLRGEGFNDPVFALSGNGYHLLYNCDLEASTETDECIKSFLKALGHLFDGDGVKVDQSVYNRARICKLYGTTANKGADTQERPHRKSRIIEVPAEVKANPLSLFAKVAALIPADSHTAASRPSHRTGGGLNFDVAGFLEAHNIEYKKESVTDGERYTLQNCVFDPEHKGAAVIKYNDGKIIYKCFHNSCAGYGWREFRQKYDPQREWGRNTPREDFAGFLDNDTESGGDGWAAHLTRDKHGNVEKTAENLTLIARNDEELKGISYNTFSGRYEAAQNSRFRAPETKSINDNSLAAISRYLETKYGLCIRAAAVDEKILSVISECRAFHPVKEFIEAERWDNTPRVDTLLVDYLGAEDSDFIRNVTRKWMAAAVARIYRPGRKFDYVLTLSGGQGTGKSTFFRTLAGEWFNDTFSFAMDGRQQREALKGKWVIEMAELAGLRKIEVEAAKAFISSTEDFFRPAYARMVEEWPRQCVFAATTNEPYFLRSTTGDRRWWVVDVSGAGMVADWLPRLQKNVGQIWAEAFAIFKDGETLYLSPDMEREAARQQALHNSENDSGVIGELGAWLDIPLPLDWQSKNKLERQQFFKYDDNDGLRAAGDGVEQRQTVSVAEIKNEFPHPEVLKATPHQINFWLLQNGWERLQNPRKLAVYGSQRIFVRPCDDGEDDEIL